MPPSGSNGSDTNFGPIAVKGSGHETGQEVNGAPVELLVSQPTLTVSILLCQRAACSKKSNFQRKTLHSLQQTKSAVCNCGATIQGTTIALALAAIPPTEQNIQSSPGQQSL